jgi:hypothetical protein
MKHSNINAAQLVKAEKILNTQVNYAQGGIMTRLKWLKIQLSKGATVNESTKSKIHYNRLKYNRFDNYEAQQEYERKCNERIPCYELHLPNEAAYWEITKTEFDRYRQLELETDLRTQKMELPNKIEAGTATEEEIKADAKEDLQFFSKYMDY